MIHLPSALQMLWWLLVAHALCDGPLQVGHIVELKSKPIDTAEWLMGMCGHALLHGGAVALVTHRVHLGIAEAAMHFCIDRFKRAGYIGSITDQSLHVMCKLGWLLLIFGGA